MKINVPYREKLLGFTRVVVVKYYYFMCAFTK